MKRILFVCTGNICRSPTADGVARHLARQVGVQPLFEFDSAGTHAYHNGESPDLRAQGVAKLRGYDLSELRARPVLPDDFVRFDLILAMDKGHLVYLRRQCPASFQSKLDLYLNYSATQRGQDVVDPYYGELDGFERVLVQCEEVSAVLLDLR